MVKGESYESSIAVGTVVVFGTIAMFVYPFLYSHGFLDMSEKAYGMFVGGTLHEVAHAVAAGQAISIDAGNTAVIVKMLRVIMIAPLLICLGFWLNRSFSLAYVLAACMGFFPSLAQNPGWYVVIAGALLPPLILGKNIYCTFVCPFCGLQELTHKISRVNLSTGPLLKILRPLRFVFLFVALFIGFLFLNPSCGSYEPFGTVFGLNGEDFNWYLLFVALVASFFFHRFWCHVFCPAGALLDFAASKRRDAGKKLCGKKKCPSGAKCGAAVRPAARRGRRADRKRRRRPSSKTEQTPPGVRPKLRCSS